MMMLIMWEDDDEVILSMIRKIVTVMFTLDHPGDSGIDCSGDACTIVGQ